MSPFYSFFNAAESCGDGKRLTLLESDVAVVDKNVIMAKFIKEEGRGTVEKKREIVFYRIHWFFRVCFVDERI